MKRFKVLGVVAAGVAWAVLGFTSTASAQTAPDLPVNPDDLPVFLENLPAAGEQLAAGVQDAVTTLAETQSAQATSAAVGDAVVATGTVLAAGTEQAGALGFGLQIVNNVAQNALAPYLQAVDDPSTAPNLVNPDDIAALVTNAPPAVEAAQPFLVEGAIRVLQGDLEGSFSFGFANAALEGANVLTAGTSLQPTAFGLVGVGLIVVFLGAGQPLTQAGEALAPAFDAAAPVTEQLIGILEGI